MRASISKTTAPGTAFFSMLGYS